MYRPCSGQQLVIERLAAVFWGLGAALSDLVASNTRDTEEYNLRLNWTAALIAIRPTLLLNGLRLTFENLR